MMTTDKSRADALTLSTYCPHGIHWDNACGACNPSRGTKVRTASPVEQPAAAPIDEPKLAVWYGSMPESNGKSNWTAILHNGNIGRGITLDRSEYPDRVRYEADRARWLIGELAVEPSILDYDADKHSGYTAPSPADERAARAEAALRALVEECENDAIAGWEERMRRRIDDANRVLARAASANETGAEGATQASEEFRQIALTELYEFQELTGCSTSDEYRAKLAAMAAEAPAIPAGYALVPIEPTDAMIESGAAAGVPDGEGLYYPFSADEIGIAYCAMIAARPRAPQPAQATALVGLTYQQVEALAAKHQFDMTSFDYVDSNSLVDLVNDALRSIGQAEPRAEVTHGDTTMDECMASLLDRLEAAEVYADRYRYLRERPLDAVSAGGVFAGKTPENIVLNGADLDAAIDAAMKEVN